MNARERRVWRNVFTEMGQKMIEDLREQAGDDAVTEFGLMWAEAEEKWLRENRPEHPFLKLLDQRRRENNV